MSNSHSDVPSPIRASARVSSAACDCLATRSLSSRDLQLRFRDRSGSSGDPSVSHGPVDRRPCPSAVVGEVLLPDRLEAVGLSPAESRDDRAPVLLEGPLDVLTPLVKRPSTGGSSTPGWLMRASPFPTDEGASGASLSRWRCSPGCSTLTPRSAGRSCATSTDAPAAGGARRAGPRRDRGLGRPPPRAAGRRRTVGRRHATSRRRSRTPSRASPEDRHNVQLAPAA